MHHCHLCLCNFLWFWQDNSLPFDIHDYGDRVVSALSTVGQRRSFSSVVAGLDNFEACKYLLASLQLVNPMHTHSAALEATKHTADTPLPVKDHNIVQNHSVHPDTPETACCGVCVSLRLTTTQWRWTVTVVWTRWR